MLPRRELLAVGALPALLGLAAPSIARAQLPVAARPGARRVETFDLANGLKVLVLPSRRAPIVQQMLWYRVGSADEAPGKSGIAHFLEHLMFKGTPEVPAGEFSKRVSRVGGRDNAFTSFDYTAYHQNVAADRLEMIMRMEADRMANLIVSEKELLPERDVILEERRQVVESRPSSLLDEVTREALFGRRAYGVPIIGYPEEIAKLGVDDARSFHDLHYAPNNAILIVAGDTTVEAVRALAERYYAPARPKTIPARVRPDAPAADLPRQVERVDKRVAQPEWSRDYIAPSYRKGATEHAFGLQILTQVLGGHQTSRLYRSLVVDRKIALEAAAGYSARSLGLTAFGIGLSPAPQRTIAEIETAAMAEIERVRQDGVTAEEVERAKRRLIASTVYALDSMSSGPGLYGAALATGGTVAEVDEWPERIAATTVAQVNAAARATLDDKRAVTSLLLPETKR
ncbi:MAG: insulinase family protein [Rhodospirillales bacterium]|nr:MAG: insulinase family protein [Rhodospirillales bacterium]